MGSGQLSIQTDVEKVAGMDYWGYLAHPPPPPPPLFFCLLFCLSGLFLYLISYIFLLIIVIFDVSECSGMFRYVPMSMFLLY